MSYSVPAGVKKEAMQGRDLYKKFGYGGGKVTAKINSMLINKSEVSHGIAIKVHTYYRRHEKVDPPAKNFADKKNPSKGYIMWKMMGGNSGQSWSRRLKKTLDVIQKRERLNKINRTLEAIHGMVR